MLKPVFFAVALCVSTLAVAQDAYPSKPITLIVPNPPGGFVDASARLLSEPLGRVANQSIVVDNRGGGSGNVAYQAVARAKPDGYTLLISYSAYHVGNPALAPNLPWDPVKDFAPVALLTVATNVVAVHPSVPANNLKEFIAFLKQNPAKLNYASQGNGSLSHIGTEVFKQQTGTFMTHIPYRGSGPAVQDVLSGQVQVFITTPPSVMGHVQAGKLKAFAVTGDKRSPQMPQIPTTAEAGLPGFKLEAWVGLFAPAGTPPAVIAKLTADVKRAMEMPDVKTRADAAGIEIRYQGPDALADLVKSDLAYWSKTIKAAGIKAD
ncbi:Bug family tripartite tricarboxylate transporter substrate binding protein [Polaromonas sp.]|uniref:Bug family tripartite tricarboxylate transporter substrate binding protein n=1 Tax=Polaromonas sp. TaxID=1869339 RepID=UPI003750B49E